MRSFRWSFWVVLAVVSACSARTPIAEQCAPVPAEFSLVGQRVYRECDVDRRPKRQSRPTSMNYTPSAGQHCGRVVVDMVVDSTGRVVPELARIVRATDPAFGLAVLQSLGDEKYEPAQKDGRPVATLVRYERGFSTVIASRGGARTRRPPPC